MASFLFGGLCLVLGGWFRVQHSHDQRLVIVRAAVDGLAVQPGFQLTGQGVRLARFFGQRGGHGGEEPRKRGLRGHVQHHAFYAIRKQCQRIDRLSGDVRAQGRGRLVGDKARGGRVFAMVRPGKCLPGSTVGQACHDAAITNVGHQRFLSVGKGQN